MSIKYFGFSTNPLEMKRIPQVKDIKKMSLNSLGIRDEKYLLYNIENNYTFLDYTPTIYHYEIWNSARLTDIINYTLDIGNRIISNKVKNIFEEFGITDVQFFSTSVFHKETEHINYWYMHPSTHHNDLVDYEKSEIMLFKETWDKDGEAITGIKNYKEFLNCKKEMFNKENSTQFLNIKKIVLKETNRDFLQFKGILHDYHSPFYVSEKVKNRLESEKLSGLKYIPINEKWL